MKTGKEIIMMGIRDGILSGAVSIDGNFVGKIDCGQLASLIDYELKKEINEITEMKNRYHEQLIDKEDECRMLKKDLKTVIHAKEDLHKELISLKESTIQK